MKTKYVTADSLYTVSKFENDTETTIIKIISIYLKTGLIIDLKDKNATIDINDSFQGISYNVNESKRTQIQMLEISAAKIEIVKSRNAIGIVLISSVAFICFIALVNALSHIKLG